MPLLQELKQFTGTEVFYRHSFNRRIVYTEGVRYLATEAQAYWLIDAIASHISSPLFQRAMTKDERIGERHFWTLHVKPDNSAVLEAKVDSPERALVTQKLTFTDFPLPEIQIWVGNNGQGWTLYLPSEH